MTKMPTAQQKNIYVYPNPATEYLYIRNPNKGNQTISLFNHEGKKVLELINKNAAQTRISCKRFLPGCYIITVFDNTNSILKKTKKITYADLKKCLSSGKI